MEADIKAAIAERDRRRNELGDLLDRKGEIADQLEQAETDAEEVLASLGKAIADKSPEAASIKSKLTAARIEADALEAAQIEIGARIKSGKLAVQEAERQAGLLEIQWHRREAERLACETLAAADVLARSHARWHAHARRAEHVARLIGVAGQPVPFDGVHAHLSRVADDSQGIFGALRKHGIDARFAAIRELLPQAPALTDHTSAIDEDEDDDQETEDSLPDVYDDGDAVVDDN